MSVEIWFHPQKATKKQLISFLESLSFMPCEHLWNWPKGSVHFHWFEAADFRSFDGVEATVHKPLEDPHGLGPCAWALHTRTRSGGSPTDKQFQIDTINRAKHQFGGNFYNDWGGRNKHMKAPIERRDASARGLYLTYERVNKHLKNVMFALPTEHDGLKNLVATPYAAMAREDPARVIYNALIPFAVASLEAFFSEAFAILIRYDASAQSPLEKQGRKVDFEDVKAIADGHKRIEDVVASWYSFQNIRSIQKAFSEWLDLDLLKILRTTDSVYNPGETLDQIFGKVVNMRHRIIHGLDLEYDTDRVAILRILEDVTRIIDTFVENLEEKSGKIIRDEVTLGLVDENTTVSDGEKDG